MFYKFAAKIQSYLVIANQPFVSVALIQSNKTRRKQKRKKSHGPIIKSVIFEPTLTLKVLIMILPSHQDGNKHLVDLNLSQYRPGNSFMKRKSSDAKTIRVEIFLHLMESRKKPTAHPLLRPSNQHFYIKDDTSNPSDWHRILTN